MKDYLLLMREGDFNHAPLTRIESEEYVDLWDAFMEGLVREGNLRGGLPLSTTSRILTKFGTSENIAGIVDGKIITGFLILKACDYEHAVSLSRGCPILAYNGSIEIRETIQKCN